jgi:hypothetical protein
MHARDEVCFLRHLSPFFAKQPIACYPDEFPIENYDTDNVGPKELAVGGLEATFTRIETFNP